MKPLFIILPILLVGGFVGAAAMGVVHVPGISPKKAQGKANAVYSADAGGEVAATDTTDTTDQTDTAEATEPTTGPAAEEAQTPPDVNVTATQQTTTPTENVEQGAKALAKYWDEIETPKLIPITETYKDAELAQILYFMDKKKVAELLSRVSAERAASLSHELQRLASVVKPAA
jgi:hypothetical protein